MDKEIVRVLNKHGDMRGNFRIFAKEMFEEKIFADYDVILFFFLPTSICLVPLGICCVAYLCYGGRLVECKT